MRIRKKKRETRKEEERQNAKIRRGEKGIEKRKRDEIRKIYDRKDWKLRQKM